MLPQAHVVEHSSCGVPKREQGAGSSALGLSIGSGLLEGQNTDSPSFVPVPLATLHKGIGQVQFCYTSLFSQHSKPPRLAVIGRNNFCMSQKKPE